MKVLVYDNYDSFTYNLVHLAEKIDGVEVVVHRNDAISVAEADQFDRIIFSPGPGIPSEAGNLLEMIRTYTGRKPILGVCLGHQAMAEAFGGELENLPEVFHGVATPMRLAADPGFLFQHIPSPFLAGRYHSWCVSDENFPADFFVTARDEAGRIMAMQHRRWPVAGVQFHPESILTEHGETLLRNFISLPGQEAV